jgi:transposase
MTRARILLKADSSQPDGGGRDEAISEALDVEVATVERVRRRCVELGLAAALKRQPGGGRKQDALNGEQEAHLIALVCGQPPEGQGQWTLRLLAERMVELGQVNSVSHKTNC